jgi:hypothetical protein
MIQTPLETRIQARVSTAYFRGPHQCTGKIGVDVVKYAEFDLNMSHAFMT